MSKLDNLSPARLASNPRANERAWLRYSALLLAAFRQHPIPYIYTPLSTAPSSTVTKLRDALRGALAFGYADASVPRADLTRWWFETTVTAHLKTIRIGPPQKLAPPLEDGGQQNSSNGLFFEVLSFEEVCAFALLLGNGKLAGPVRVKAPPDLSLLTDRLNVEIVRKDDGSLILL